MFLKYSITFLAHKTCRCILGCIAYIFNRGVDASQANLLRNALLVFSAYGGCSRETHHFLNTLSEQLSDKKGILPGVVMNWLRTKICFAQMRALILCVRGSRSLWHRPTLNATDIELSNLDSDIN